MSKEIVRPIYDTRARILDFDIYPYTEGRVFFDEQNQVIYTDIDGQRAARTDLSSVQVFDGDISEFYERGAKGFENQILVGRTPSGFRLYYVDGDSQVHNLTFTAEGIGSFAERGATETATFYYAGEWKNNKTYTADAFRIAVVKEGSDFYYARETHTVSVGETFDVSLWIKFSAQFESIATGLLLAEDAIITRTLTMGSEVGNPSQFGVIKSSGVVSFTDFGASNSGFYMDASGRMRFGNTTGNNISWDGTNLNIVGGITVSYNDITGNKPPIDADNTASAFPTVISGNTVTTGTLQVRQGGTADIAAGITGQSTGDTAVRIFAGSTFDNRGTAPFRVTQGGALTATSATIQGNITATSGTIGSNATAGNRWQIGSTSIFNGKTSLTNTTAGTYIGTDGIALGTQNVTPQFSVTQAGDLTARSVTIRNSANNKNFIQGNTFYNNLIGNTSITATVTSSFFSGSLMLTPNASSIVSLDKVDIYVTVSGRPSTTLPAALDSIRIDIQPMLQAFQSLTTTFTNKATSFNNTITIQGVNVATQTKYTLVTLASGDLSGTAKNRVAGPLLCIITLLDTNGNTVTVGAGTTIDIAVSAFGFFDPVQLSDVVVSS